MLLRWRCEHVVPQPEASYSFLHVHGVHVFVTPYEQRKLDVLRTFFDRLFQPVLAFCKAFVLLFEHVSAGFFYYIDAY